jgi:hypothetical protein
MYPMPASLVAAYFRRKTQRRRAQLALRQAIDAQVMREAQARAAKRSTDLLRAVVRQGEQLPTYIPDSTLRACREELARRGNAD